MATIHIEEIQKLLAERGEKDAQPWSGGGYFLEIRFDDSLRPPPVAVDQEFANKVITADSPFGHVTIQFDSHGQLKSIDLS